MQRCASITVTVLLNYCMRLKRMHLTLIGTILDLYSNLLPRLSTVHADETSFAVYCGQLDYRWAYLVNMTALGFFMIYISFSALLTTSLVWLPRMNMAVLVFSMIWDSFASRKRLERLFFGLLQKNVERKKKMNSFYQHSIVGEWK